jgi:hypothetical protein
MFGGGSRLRWHATISSERIEVWRGQWRAKRRPGVSKDRYSPTTETGCRADCRAGTQNRKASPVTALEKGKPHGMTAKNVHLAGYILFTPGVLPDDRISRRTNCFI